ncbi:MAG: hypothetical protein EKK51_00205 [Mycolicibacterium sp.]|uniref:hypothetical protein n=1 Tax=Mycolicibacterium sp. TaxID=2320850 RepID=UPI000FAF35AF|nr:hypothetical protein [Mycolicibacterium sp.]RUP35015.1 MAG: hypothetical protein EKK51_00205 [Mycolicibacterium sp.]
MTTAGRYQCAPWCTEGNGHPDYFLRADQSCWGPERKTVLSLENDAPALPMERVPCDAPAIAVYPYQGWYQLPKIKLHIYAERQDLDVDFLLTPAEAIELAEHLITTVETIALAEASRR